MTKIDEVTAVLVFSDYGRPSSHRKHDLITYLVCNVCYDVCYDLSKGF